MKKNLIKSISLVLVTVLMLTMLVGCGKSEKASTKGNEKVTITIGKWPGAGDTPERKEQYDKWKKEFEAKYPNIEVKGDTWTFDVKTFAVKAAANQLPTLYNVFFTETSKVLKGNYAADITEAMDEYGFMDSLNPDLLSLITDENGRCYGIPMSAYAQGLYINKAIFKEAGLVNEDGSIKVPNTYLEMAEYGKIIKEKTGKAGFILPTNGNGGGWFLLNIGYAFGVDFIEEQKDGRWKATFDTPEFRDTLQYIHDLKWKYNALHDNALISVLDALKMFGTYQGGMTFYRPHASEMKIQYGMKIEDIYAARIPEGKAGRISQMGGEYWAISSSATKEQIDACFKWLEFTGTTPKVTEERKQKLSENAKINKGIIVGREVYDVWVNPEYIEARKEAEAPYINVDFKDYEDYYSFKDVTIYPEPEVASQELYSVLDKAIQEILSNQDVDINALATATVDDFQKNHLDKLD